MGSYNLGVYFRGYTPLKGWAVLSVRKCCWQETGQQVTVHVMCFLDV